MPLITGWRHAQNMILPSGGFFRSVISGAKLCPAALSAAPPSFLRQLKSHQFPGAHLLALLCVHVLYLISGTGTSQAYSHTPVPLSSLIHRSVIIRYGISQSTPTRGRGSGLGDLGYGSQGSARKLNNPLPLFNISYANSPTQETPTLPVLIHHLALVSGPLLGAIARAATTSDGLRPT